MPTSFTCLASCPDDATNGHYVLCADGFTCRLASSGCLPGEYLDGLICKYCNIGNGYENCEKCTSSECTECKSNHFLNCNSPKQCLVKCEDAGLVKRALTNECVSTCKTDDSSYLSVDAKNCVSSCTADLGNEFKTSIDKTTCLYPVDSCGNTGYFADATSGYFCIACNTALTNCEACTSRTVCT